MSAVDAVSTVDTTAPAPRPTVAADDIDPELLAVLARVAHREYLLGHNSSRPDRRRPATRSHAPRATRGTTARKVIWS